LCDYYLRLKIIFIATGLLHGLFNLSRRNPVIPPCPHRGGILYVWSAASVQSQLHVAAGRTKGSTWGEFGR